MKCPVDNETLLISSREGIEIDHCPQCRGVWLDRGELDKIIERAAPVAAAPPPRGDSRGYDDDRDRDRDRGYRDDRGPRDDDRYRRKKKRSLLEDLFDFD